MSTPDTTPSALEAVSARLETITQSLERTAAAIEASNGHVTRFNESITRLETLIEQGFSKLEVQVQRQLELSRQQHETTQMQGRHIDRLMSITETLIQQRVAYRQGSVRGFQEEF